MSLNGFGVVAVGSHYHPRWGFEKWMGKEERMNYETVERQSQEVTKRDKMKILNSCSLLVLLCDSSLWEIKTTD